VGRRGRQISTDPPAMRGTSGQVYTDNIFIFQSKNYDNLFETPNLNLSCLRGLTFNYNLWCLSAFVAKRFISLEIRESSYERAFVG
jgi:hypothetical protein